MKQPHDPQDQRIKQRGGHDRSEGERKDRLDLPVEKSVRLFSVPVFIHASIIGGIGAADDVNAVTYPFLEFL